MKIATQPKNTNQSKQQKPTQPSFEALRFTFGVGGKAGEELEKFSRELRRDAKLKVAVSSYPQDIVFNVDKSKTSPNAFAITINQPQTYEQNKEIIVNPSTDKNNKSNFEKIVKEMLNEIKRVTR